MDFRIFRGVNVSRRGGFYTGVETGVLFLAPFAEISFYEPTMGKDMYFEYTGGLVFLMAKYGMRIDIGLAIFGISLGAEMGMGGTLFAGGFNFYTKDPSSPEEWYAEYGWGTDQATMGLIMDVAGEGAIRLGKNFRLIAKLGFMAAPISVPESRGWEEYWIDSTGNAYYAWDQSTDLSPIVKDRDYQRAIMAQYGVELDPFCLDLRVGFSLNFQD